MLEVIMNLTSLEERQLPVFAEQSIEAPRCKLGDNS
jgi:hypothetical protein